jgi:hypothetical protein
VEPALRSVRPRLLRAAPLPTLLHRVVEARPGGVPGSQTESCRRGRCAAAIASASRPHDGRRHQALNRAGAMRSSPTTPVVRPIHERPFHPRFRLETVACHSSSTRQGRARTRRHRYISPALTELARQRHLRIWPKNSDLLKRRNTAQGPALHLSRFRHNQLIYMVNVERRGGRPDTLWRYISPAWALQGSRKPVASLPRKRCISPRKSKFPQ